MSAYYCPAGKCECLHFHGYDNGDLCDFFDFNMTALKTCPCPSLQQPITEPCEKCTCIDHHESFEKGFAAGLIHQARVDREAIDKVDDGELYRQILDDCGKCGNIEGPCNMPECAHFTVMLIHAIDVDKMIAALAAVAPEVK